MTRSLDRRQDPLPHPYLRAGRNRWWIEPDSRSEPLESSFVSESYFDRVITNKPAVNRLIPVLRTGEGRSTKLHEIAFVSSRSAGCAPLL